MITVIVGDIHRDLSQFARERDPKAESLLLTRNSGQLARPGTYFISLYDINKYRSFVDYLEQADLIIYHPPQQWSDTNSKQQSLMKKYTECALEYLYDKIKIDNFEPKHQTHSVIAQLSDCRKTENPQLWVCGDSIHIGSCVSAQQRYGQLVADHYGLQVSYLARAGVSLLWTADQILRSDIRAGDTVILGVGPLARLTWFHNDLLVHVNPATYTTNPKFDKVCPLHLLDSATVNFYHPIMATQQVMNFCEKIGAFLIIVGTAPTLVEYFNQLPNYINLSHYRFGFMENNRWLDFGTDGKHPGPNTHRFLADNIIAKIQRLKSNSEHTGSPN